MGRDDGTLRACGALDGLDRLALEVGSLVLVVDTLLPSLIHRRGQLLQSILRFFRIAGLGGFQGLLPQGFHPGAENLVAIGPALYLTDPLKGRF